MKHCIGTVGAEGLQNIQIREDIPVVNGGSIILNPEGYLAVGEETSEESAGAYDVIQGEAEMENALENLDHTHVYGGWVQTVAPGCETEGERTRTCSDCGKTQTQAVEATGHDHYTLGSGTVKCHLCDTEWTLELSSKALHFESTSAQAQQLTSQVQPAEWATLVIWQVEAGGEAVVQVDDDGNVTPLGEGTAYILATVDGGEVSLSARCRVDVGQGLRLTARNSYVVSGKTLQMTAYRLPENTKETVTWSLADTTYATINAKSGLITAKKNLAEPVSITVMAVNQDESRIGVTDLTVLPASAKLSILHNGEVWGQTKGAVQTVTVDKYEKTVITLDARMEQVGKLDNAVWSSSSTSIAKVKDGVVTLVKPGTVTITAKDANGIAASVKLKVIYLDAASKLTAKADIPSMGLQLGYSTTMEVFGTDKEAPLPVDELTFSIPASQQSIARVDGSGMITAGNKTGTATVTAAIRNDPLKRKVTLKVKVIAVQTAEMILRAEAGEPAQVIMLDVDGKVTEDTTRAVSYQVYLDKDHVQSGSYKFTIGKELIGKKADGSLVAMTGTAVTWATTDNRVATVAANKDGSATVTVKAKTDGACVITATSKDIAKIQSGVMVYVRDYAPRLESTSLTMNSKRLSGVSTRLVESYDAEITSWKLYEYDSKTKKYLTEESTRLTPVWENGVLTIKPEMEIKNSAIKLRLDVGYRKTPDGEERKKEFFLTLKVSNSVPTITVKQDAKFNLHTGTETKLTVTAANAAVTNVAVDEPETSTFCQKAYADGVVTLELTPAYKDLGVLDAKVTLQVSLNDYRDPVSKTVTMSTAVNKPSITVKQPAKFNLFYKDSKAAIQVTAKNLVVRDVKLVPGSTATFERVEFNPETGNLTIGFTEDYITNRGKVDTSASLLIYLDGYNAPITKAVTIGTVTTKPSVSLTPASSVINTVLSDDHSALIRVYNKTAQEYVPVLAENVKASFATMTQEENEVRLTLTEVPGKTNKGGTATVTVQPENWMSAIKLSYKVTVQSAMPTVSFTQSTVKLNRVFPHETAQTEVVLSQSNLTIDGITLQRAPKTDAQLEDIYNINYEISGNKITFSMDPNYMPKSGTYEFRCTVRSGGLYLPIKTIKVTVVATAPGVKLKSSTIKVNKLYDYTFNSDEMPKTSASLTNGSGYQLSGLEVMSTTHNAVTAFYDPTDGMIYPILMDTVPNGKYTLMLQPTLRQLEPERTIVLPAEFFVKLTIQVRDTKPVPKLGKSTLTLNRVFCLQEDVTTLKMNSVYAKVKSVSFEPTAKAGTDARKQADKIALYYSDGQIGAGMRSINDIPKAGTYSYRYTVTLDNDLVLSPQTIKVTVNAALPTVKLSTSTVKLNKLLKKQAVGEAAVTITGGGTYVVEDLVPPDNWSNNDISISYSEHTGKLTVNLKNVNAASKTHKITLTPVVRLGDTGLRVYLSKKLTLNVQVYSGTPTVTLSAKGKLDAILADSAITYTVSKLTNIAGTIEKVELAGADAALFKAELVNSGSKPAVKLTMAEGAVFATNMTYKPQLVFHIGDRAITNTVSVKVSQSGLKFASVAAMPVYQSQTRTVRCTVTMTSPAGAEMDKIALSTKSSATFLKALGADNNMMVSMAADKRSAMVTFFVKNPGYLTYGKSYTVYLDVTPEGCASNVKPTQVKLTVKAYK